MSLQGKLSVLPVFQDFAGLVGPAASLDRYRSPDLCHKNADGDYVRNQEAHA